MNTEPFGDVNFGSPAEPFGDVKTGPPTVDVGRDVSALKSDVENSQLARNLGYVAKVPAVAAIGRPLLKTAGWGFKLAGAPLQVVSNLFGMPQRFISGLVTGPGIFGRLRQGMYEAFHPGMQATFDTQLERQIGLDKLFAKARELNPNEPVYLDLGGVRFAIPAMWIKNAAKFGEDELAENITDPLNLLFFSGALRRLVAKAGIKAFEGIGSGLIKAGDYLGPRLTTALGQGRAVEDEAASASRDAREAIDAVRQVHPHWDGTSEGLAQLPPPVDATDAGLREYASAKLASLRRAEAALAVHRQAAKWGTNIARWVRPLGRLKEVARKPLERAVVSTFNHGRSLHRTLAQQMRKVLEENRAAINEADRLARLRGVQPVLPEPVRRAFQKMAWVLGTPSVRRQVEEDGYIPDEFDRQLPLIGALGTYRKEYIPEPLLFEESGEPLRAGEVVHLGEPGYARPRMTEGTSESLWEKVKQRMDDYLSDLGPGKRDLLAKAFLLHGDPSSGWPGLIRSDLLDEKALLDRIEAAKARGEDTSRLEAELGALRAERERHLGFVSSLVRDLGDLVPLGHLAESGRDALWLTGAQLRRMFHEQAVRNLGLHPDEMRKALAEQVPADEFESFEKQYEVPPSALELMTQHLGGFPEYGKGLLSIGARARRTASLERYAAGRLSLAYTRERSLLVAKRMAQTIASRVERLAKSEAAIRAAQRAKESLEQAARASEHSIAGHVHAFRQGLEERSMFTTPEAGRQMVEELTAPLESLPEDLAGQIGAQGSQLRRRLEESLVKRYGPAAASRIVSKLEARLRLGGGAAEQARRRIEKLLGTAARSRRRVTSAYAESEEAAAAEREARLATLRARLEKEYGPAAARRVLARVEREMERSSRSSERLGERLDDILRGLSEQGRAIVESLASAAEEGAARNMRVVQAMYRALPLGSEERREFAREFAREYGAGIGKVALEAAAGIRSAKAAMRLAIAKHVARLERREAQIWQGARRMEERVGYEAADNAREISNRSQRLLEESIAQREARIREFERLSQRLEKYVSSADRMEAKAAQRDATIARELADRERYNQTLERIQLEVERLVDAYRSQLVPKAVLDELFATPVVKTRLSWLTIPTGLSKWLMFANPFVHAPKNIGTLETLGPAGFTAIIRGIGYHLGENREKYRSLLARLERTGGLAHFESEDEVLGRAGRWGRSRTQAMDSTLRAALLDYLDNSSDIDPFTNMAYRDLPDYEKAAIINEELGEYEHRSEAARFLEGLGIPFPHWRLTMIARVLRSMLQRPHQMNLYLRHVVLFNRDMMAGAPYEMGFYTPVDTGLEGLDPFTFNRWVQGLHGILDLATGRYRATLGPASFVLGGTKAQREQGASLPLWARLLLLGGVESVFGVYPRGRPKGVEGAPDWSWFFGDRPAFDPFSGLNASKEPFSDVNVSKEPFSDVLVGGP